MDNYLRDWIARNGSVGDCEFCGTKHVKTVDASELADLFEPLMSLYAPLRVGENMMPDDDPTIVGESLDYLLDDDWRIWSDRFPTEKRVQFLKQVVSSEYEVDELWTDQEAFWERALRDYWAAFSYHLRYERRFIPDSRNTEVISPASWLPEALPLVEERLAESTMLLRARLGEVTDKWGRLLPYPPSEMGAPASKGCRGGRANPLGIPFLYAATDELTAVAEVRPWKAAHVTVASLRLARSVRLINLTHVPYLDSPFGREDLQAQVEHRDVLRFLGRELSRPIGPEDSEVEYTPTQYMAEIIRDCGYDGLRYPSALGPGENLVFFDTGAAVVTETHVMEVVEMNYDLKPYADAR